MELSLLRTGLCMLCCLWCIVMQCMLVSHDVIGLCDVLHGCQVCNVSGVLELESSSGDVTATVSVPHGYV